MATNAPLIVVMGVSGCGKSTVGAELAERLSLPFAEGDSLHPRANVEKMASGTPLDDADREPWLDSIARWLVEYREQGGVITCSALKRRYRDRLAAAVPGVFSLHLDGSQELITDRLADRKDHFMPGALLNSQFAALEPLAPEENGAVVGIDATPEAIVQQSLDVLRAAYSVEVAPGVHAYVQADGGWCLSNAGFVSDGHSTLLIDTAATERRTRMLRDAVLASGAPLPSLVVNTHYHGDHTYGNSLFAGTATIIGHAACRELVLATGQHLHALWPEVDYGKLSVTPPSVTYTGSMTLHIGESEVQLIHPGPAHTTSDTIVWLPQQRVVFTGDLIFHGGTPFVPMGSLQGSLDALDRLRALDARTVVPGHGPVTDPGVYEAVERYLRFVGQLAESSRAAGLSPLQAAQHAELGEFAGLRESERLVANLHRAYAELDGLPPGSPIDPLVVFGDMAAMNGGVMAPSHA